MLILRTAVASALCIVAAVCMRSWGSYLPWQLYIPAGLLAASALLLHHRHVGSQLLVRAALWSNLLLGMIIAWAGSGGEQRVAGILAGATGFALLLLGRHGLEGEPRGARFVPVAFRSTLTAILVMALADAQTLLLFGSMLATESARSYGPTGLAALALAGALFLSIAGLYSLKFWGLLLNLVSCGALIAVSVAGLLDLPGEFRVAFIATGALQILLAVPLLGALVTGAKQQPATLPRRTVWLGAVTVVAVMGAAAWPIVSRAF